LDADQPLAVTRKVHLAFSSDLPATAPVNGDAGRLQQVIGNLVVESDRTDLTPDEIDLIHTVTTESAIAMENARLLTESQRSADREQLVTDVVSRVRTSTDVDAVLQTTIREIGRIMRASGGLIQLNVGFTEGRKEEENNGSHSEPQEMSQ